MKHEISLPRQAEQALGDGVAEHLGHDHFMWACDYPHPDSTWPESHKAIEHALGKLSPEAIRKVTSGSGEGLERVCPNVAGIDLGSREHWVCGRDRSDGTRNVRRFGTTTPELERLTQWLLEEGVESAAMESTSVYWVPLCEPLESKGIEVVLVNARHLSGVPGRKSDMIDCQWLQRLHS